MGIIKVELGYETCDICGCKSKFIEKATTIYGSKTKMICPGAEKYPDFHAELMNKLEALEDLKHTKSYKEELKEEIRELKEKFKDIPPKENL